MHNHHHHHHHHHHQHHPKTLPAAKNHTGGTTYQTSADLESADKLQYLLRALKKPAKIQQIQTIQAKVCKQLTRVDTQSLAQ